MPEQQLSLSGPPPSVLEALRGSLAKSLMIALDRTGLEEPMLGTEID
jgi:hypothetical protein